MYRVVHWISVKFQESLNVRLESHRFMGDVLENSFFMMEYKLA